MKIVTIENRILQASNKFEDILKSKYKKS